MPDINEKNIVDMLREKTEEADLEQLLKSTIGGYTKKSVMQYFAALKKQQQATTETFNHNLQTLYEEKKSLQSNNEILRSKLTKAETGLENLSEAMATYKLEDKVYSVQDIIALKSKIVALESEIKKMSGANHELEKKIERLNVTISEKDKELEKSGQETQIQRELLVTEKSETRKQRDLVLELSGTVEEFRDEIKYLKGIVTEGKTAELNARIDELLASTSTQGEIIARRNLELAEKEKAMETLREENEALKQSMTHLSQSLNQMMLQNEKLVSSNRAITSKLEETYKNTIELINEKSEVTVEKLILGRKLDEAKLRLSSLEMETRRLSKAESIGKNSASTDQKQEK